MLKQHLPNYSDLFSWRFIFISELKIYLEGKKTAQNYTIWKDGFQGFLLQKNRWKKKSWYDTDKLEKM